MQQVMNLSTASAVVAQAAGAPSGPGALETLLTAFKPLLPIPVLCIVLPALWWFFRSTWRELDDEATTYRVELY